MGCDSIKRHVLRQSRKFRSCAPAGFRANGHKFSWLHLVVFYTFYLCNSNSQFIPVSLFILSVISSFFPLYCPILYILFWIRATWLHNPTHCFLIVIFVTKLTKNNEDDQEDDIESRNHFGQKESQRPLCPTGAVSTLKTSDQLEPTHGRIRKFHFQ